MTGCEAVLEYPRSPAELPRSLLANPGLCKALQRREFSAVFTAAHRAGISYNKMAEACGFKAERVSKIAQGSATVTSITAIERIADGLRIPGRLLGLAARPWEGTPGPDREQLDGEEDPMKRRSLLRGTVAAGLTTPVAAALTAARNDLDSALSEQRTADLSFWESTVERYGYGYNGRPPADLLAELITDFSELTSLLGVPQSIAARARLCRVVSQMAAMAAIVLHDLGDHRESMRWFQTAGHAAHESGDTDLHAWVRAKEAMVPLNFGSPAAAAHLAEQARVLVGRQPSVAAAQACAMAARAHAANGHRENALAAISAAEHTMEQLTAGQAANTRLGYPEQQHRIHLSQALTLLGETRRAYAEQDRALELTRRPSVMSRALVALDRAACLAHDGELEEAARLATQAYGQLPRSYRSGLTHTRAQAVYRSVRQAPGAQELREVLQGTL